MQAWSRSWGILNEYVRFVDIASAEGVKLRLPKARSPLRLGGLGVRRKLPQRGLGGAPETDAILNISCEMEYIFGSCKSHIFKQSNRKNSSLTLLIYEKV